MESPGFRAVGMARATFGTQGLVPDKGFAGRSLGGMAGFALCALMGAIEFESRVSVVVETFGEPIGGGVAPIAFHLEIRGLGVNLPELTAMLVFMAFIALALAFREIG